MDTDNKKSNKTFLFVISFIFLCMLFISIILGISNSKLRKKLNILENEISSENAKTPDNDESSGVYSYSEISVVSNTHEDDAKSQSEKVRKVYLTFDDGPSPNTDKILDILKKYDVKATFFVVGKGDKYIPMYQRIADEGHTIGMHSYSHKYSDIYVSIEAFSEDLSKLQEFIYENTGVWSRIYRFPGGSSNAVSSIPITEIIEYLNDQGIVYYDWNIASGDAVEGGVTKETIINNCMSSIEKYDECVILLHDLPEKITTVEALEELIQKIQALDNTVLLPITEDTVPVQHVPAF